jgi:hypothetical protein
LGELVGIPKLSVDFDTVSDADLLTYCRRDVEILVRLWVKWFEFLTTHDLGQWYRTLPSQAFGAFRHRFMHHTILIHNHKRALALERQTYHGGRVECLRVGKFTSGPFYKLDVNSMYPYVMRKFTYPTSLVGYEKNVSVAYLYHRLRKYHVVADVTLTTPVAAFPHKVNGHIAYPLGTFRTSLTTEELKLIRETGTIHEVHAVSHYRAAPIFRDYVDYFYPLKASYTADGNATFRAITKGLLNYLYGKFGQRGLSDKLLGDCPPGEYRIVDCVDVETNKRYSLIYIGGRVIRRERTDESYNSFPAIASEVTSNSRLYLFTLLQQAGRSNVYYMDTDSLVVSEAGLANLNSYVSDDALGGLKLEGQADFLDIRAPKDYTFGAKTRIKGVRSNAIRLASNVYRQDRFPSIQGLLRQEQMTSYVVTQVTKTLAREIYSGDVTPDGYVLPFQLPLELPAPV